jgi:hypothetical protein
MKYQRIKKSSLTAGWSAFYNRHQLAQAKGFKDVLNLEGVFQLGKKKDYRLKRIKCKPLLK